MYVRFSHLHRNSGATELTSGQKIFSSALCFGALGLMIAGIIRTNFVKQNNPMELIDYYAAKYLNKHANSYVDTFETNKISINESHSQFTIRLTGCANGMKKTYNYANITYKVDYKFNEQLKQHLNKEGSPEDFEKEFLNTLVHIIENSSVLDFSLGDIAMVDGGEMVLDANVPQIDEETKTVSYKLNLMKLVGTDLKIGTFEVSAPLDDDLRQKPELIYLKKADECNIEVVDVKTFQNVNNAIKDDNFMTFA